MSESEAHQKLITALLTQLRITSANSVMHSQAIADRVGIHSTDNECLDFLLLNGPSSAGQLAVLTGLTTGAVTAMIDRLEKAGYVERQHDKTDRRRVLVVPNIAKIDAEVAPHAVRMGEAMVRLFGDFTDDELATLLRFMTRANELATDVITSLRKDSSARV